MTINDLQYRNRFAVAPMIDWTDRHCRFFHRQLTVNAVLYTEMIVADAILHGPRERLLAFDAQEHPVALQLGGSNPAKLAEASRIGASFGYDEINLNVGCPSDRVQSGTFGACLMLTPHVVAECISAIKSAVDIPVTVKCRIGVDDQDEETALDELADAVHVAGADAIWVHARKAWLQGLSPKENREIPTLNYNRVYRLKQRYPKWFVGINGGIAGPEAGLAHMDFVDGVMLGRASYQEPACLFHVDQLYFDQLAKVMDFNGLLDAMCNYIDRHMAGCGKLSQVTRHMVGLFHGLPGARKYRQILSVDANKPNAGPEVLRRAFAAVLEVEASAA